MFRPEGEARGQETRMAGAIGEADTNHEKH